MSHSANLFCIQMKPVWILQNLWYEYHFENDYRSVLVDQNIWINKEGECYVEDAGAS